MRKVIVDEWMTLDGVAQAPMETNEDTGGGFQTWVVRNLNEAGGFIFGRRTYESVAGHCPNAPEEEQAALPMRRISRSDKRGWIHRHLRLRQRLNDRAEAPHSAEPLTCTAMVAGGGFEPPTFGL
jgi:hypothetical protein